LQFLLGSTNRSFRLDDLSLLSKLLKLTGISRLFVNEIVTDENPLELVSFLVHLKTQFGLRVTIPVHDFYSLCPSYTLLNDAGTFCGLPDREKCRQCLPLNTHALNPKAETIDSWRQGWLKLLSVADEIVCFSQSSRELLLRVYPQISSTITVKPHQLNVAFDRRPRPSTGSLLRIGVVGNIGFQKGSSVLKQLARVLEKRDPAARIVVIGSIDSTDGLTNVETTGSYSPEQLPDLIERENLSFVLFPSIWPETFSYVTQEIIELEVPLAVFDIGAPAERVRRYRKGLILSPSLAAEPEGLYEQLGLFHKRCRTNSW
jgi:glycosyltransferase involved in cell wall biosynthesis